MNCSVSLDFTRTAIAGSVLTGQASAGGCFEVDIEADVFDNAAVGDEFMGISMLTGWRSDPSGHNLVALAAASAASNPRSPRVVTHAQPRPADP
jgi:hypothetical protein